MLIRAEEQSDWAAVHALNVSAFETPAEADLVDARSWKIIVSETMPKIADEWRPSTIGQGARRRAEARRRKNSGAGLMTQNELNCF
jgi:predicted N-acetyltransferase YhbS